MKAMLSILICAALAGYAAGGRGQHTEAATMTPLPRDVFPESRSRLPLPKREALDEQGKRIYDSVTDPKRPTLAGLQGPAGIWLHSPKVGEPIREFNHILRTQVPIEPRLRELAILVTAREMDSQFEWTAHEPVALKEGLSPAIVDIVKFRKPVPGAPEKETAIISFGRELLRNRKVRSETYAEMVKVFGQTGVVNITALMANYALTALMLAAVDQQLHEGRKPLLPLP
jgi:4-carboxymuconolactone decarboxylase